MWLMLNDAFLSIVKKDCSADSLLVRARRPGDIEKVFGRRTKVTRSTDADYLFRAVVPREEVTRALEREVMRVDYSNFKDSVTDNELHDAYLRVWTAMATVQDPRPYSEPWRRPLTNDAIKVALPLNGGTNGKAAGKKKKKRGGKVIRAEDHHMKMPTTP